MQFEPLAIPGVVLITPVPHADERGTFWEVYRSSEFAAALIDRRFRQANSVLNTHLGVVRGLHFQIPPRPSAKLVGVAHGSIFDVAVDLRLGSPTYGRHVTAILDATSQRRLFIPEGFAHGYATLEPDTTVSYSISDYWEPSLDRGVLWNDPTLDIDWPIEDPLVSEKDQRLPLLVDLASFFVYEGSS